MFITRLFKSGNNDVEELKGDLFQYMVNKMHVPLGTLGALRVVKKEVIVGERQTGVTTFRIFLPGVAKDKGVKVEEYSSLNNYPGLVLYEGHYRSKDGRADNITIDKKPER
jgi:hypothetical protein